MPDAPSTVTAAQVIAALILGGMMGMVGQGARAIVGLKKMNDDARSVDANASDFFKASRLVVSLFIGFIAGMIAAISLGLSKLISINPNDLQLLLGIAAAGYAGTDFIEGFAQNLIGKTGDIKVPQPKSSDQPCATQPKSLDQPPATQPKLPSETALEKTQPSKAPPPTGVLRGDGSFPFTVEVVGDDIVARGVRATWFGGVNDPSDSGQTASGVSTRDNPNLQGCSLPMDGFHNSKTNGSPIPRLPWKISVRVKNLKTQTECTFPLIDLGPSKFAQSHAAIDLTQAAFEAAGGRISDGVIPVDYWILGGARFVKDGTIASVSLPQSEANKNNLKSVLSDLGHGISHDIQKPAIKAFIASPNHSSRNGTPIDMIVMHYTDGSNAQGAINRFLNPAEQVSAHYIIERNGDIYQMVRDDEKAWHAKAANPRSIGIEHVALPGQQMTPAQEASSLSLLRWLMATYKIDKNGIVGHRFAPGNVGTTDCPDCLFGKAAKSAITDWVDKNFA